jgi:hypothetical protein
MTAAVVLLLGALPTPVAGDASSFGKSIALAGDLDGDRCCEVVVGSPSDGEGRRGRVLVFSGKSGELLRELLGSGPDSGFGAEVASAGDQDGDKVGDLAVGAPFVRGEGSEGRVDLFSGKDGRPIRSLSPEKDERYFGTSLTSIGDVDGDQVEDLLVRMRAGPARDEHERFVAISLASGKRLYAIDAPEGVTSHDLGRPLTPVPDVDGDKVPDFAVEFGSEVHVHSGASGKKLATMVSPLPSDAKSTFGFAICGLAGKRPMLAVGDTVEGGYGAVRLLPIRAPDEPEIEGGGLFISGDDDFSGAGRSLAPAGDCDGDGRPDLAVAWSDGRSGGAVILSTKDFSPARPLAEERSKEGRLPLGWRIAAGGDVDGDGTSDVAVSRYWPTAADTAVRSVVVFSEKDGTKIRELLSPPAPVPPAKKPK